MAGLVFFWIWTPTAFLRVPQGPSLKYVSKKNKVFDNKNLLLKCGATSMWEWSLAYLAFIVGWPLACSPNLSCPASVLYLQIFRSIALPGTCRPLLHFSTSCSVRPLTISYPSYALCDLIYCMLFSSCGHYVACPCSFSGPFCSLWSLGCAYQFQFHHFLCRPWKFILHFLAKLYYRYLAYGE